MTEQGSVLVVGASGLVGTAAAESFLRAGWEVITTSRRAPELDAPSAPGAHRHLTLDLLDGDACRRVVAEDCGGVTHVIYTAVYEMPGLIAGWRDPKQIETNGRMLENLLTPLREAGRLRHLTLLQGTKAYGVMVGPMRVPGRERQPRVEHPNFYWVQEDAVRAAAAADGWGFTILRPQIIVGPNVGVVMNLPPVIGAWAALRAAEGKPFSFPGGPVRALEAVDARLVGDACLWAATTPVAAGETYNLTNGEVFSFRDMWPALAATLGVEPGPDEPCSVAGYLTARRALWDDVVRRHGLRPLSLDALVGESHHYADMCFAFGATEPPPPAFVSTVKIKQAGFTQTCDTEESFCHWLDVLMDRKVLPRLAGG